MSKKDLKKLKLRQQFLDDRGLRAEDVMWDEIREKEYVMQETDLMDDNEDDERLSKEFERVYLPEIIQM